jgi:hypothetical protein
MPKVRALIRTTYLTLALTLVTACLPAPLLFADTCTPPPDPGPGIHHPVGADAALFTYNCDTGLWQSAHYIYDPATGLTTPIEQPIYTYNPATGQYDYTVWTFSPATNNYFELAQSTTTPPAGATVVGGPSISNTGSGSTNTIDNNGGLANGSSISGTGTGSTNTIGGSGSNNTTSNNTTGITGTNTLTAQASTGDALTISNTTAGGATSGNAQDIANVVNLLQSSSNALSGDTLTFVTNIDGDVNGDFLLDPAMLGVQSASYVPPGDNNLTLNSTTDATMNNTIDLSADSGDATVANNTTGGDATSGNATAVANIINLINSAIFSGKSFIGVININGNLNGDILLPPNFIDQLIAANVPTVTIDTTGADSNNTVSNSGPNSTTTATNTNNLGITNNLTASADTGDATTSGNTSAGDATSGTATTSITAFNLTGSNVIGSNALLVFVNVAGKWVGMIVNAPPGSTAAALGGGLTAQTGPGNTNTNIANDTTEQINNNITARATTGDATVTNNTTGGDARSGDAHAAINLLNVENSSLSLSGWLGILFINVFGTWNGSFGINTSAGDPIIRDTTQLAAAAATAGGNSTGFTAQVFRFVPHAAATTTSSSGSPTATVSNTGPNSNNAVLAAQTKTPVPQTIDTHGGGVSVAAIVGLGVILFITGDAIYSHRRRAHQV